MTVLLRTSMKPSLAIAAAALLCACSHGSPTASAPTSSAIPSACTTAGFGLSVVPGATGSSTPLAAAKDFVRQGGEPGYGSPDSSWQVGAATDGKVTVKDGQTELHAVQLPDSSWVIASGDRCG